MMKMMLLAACALSFASAMDMSKEFAKFKTCKQCIDGGYGWCPMRRKCGGFANRECGEGERYVVEGATAPSEKSHCTELTDGNFDDIVKDSSKHVLVEFFAPWCGHCKALKPAYDEVCKTFKNEPNVVVALMDATKHPNSPKDFGVQGYPTIKWFPKGNKGGEDYEGAREAKDFVKFINSKAGTSRKLGGKPTSDDGPIKALDRHVKAFFKKGADKADKSAAITEIANLVEGFSGKKKSNGEYYMKTLQKVLKKSVDYCTEEIERLQGHVDAGAISGTKSEDFSRRINILKSIGKAGGLEIDEPEEEEAPAPAASGSGGAKLSRQDLLKFSYEALIDKVLELQK